MSERVTARQFQAAEGTTDWRVLARGASATFRTGSLREGAALVERVGALADAAGHHPDVDLRSRAVVVRVLSHGEHALTTDDVGLARAVSTAARGLRLVADPSAAQDVDLTIDTQDVGAARAFWSAALGHVLAGEEDVVDPHRRWPNAWFQEMDVRRPLRNRVHLDVFVPRELRPVRHAAVLAAGGRVVNEAFAPQWWTLADPEGNEVDLEGWDVFPVDLPEPWLTPDAFLSAPGVEDWRFLQGVSAYWTGPWPHLVELVARTAALADDARLAAYVDLRPDGVTVRLGPPDEGWVARADLALAQQVQAAARALGLVADPAAVRDVQLTFDALDIRAVQRFWAAALAYVEREETDLYDPLLRGPSIFLQQLDAPREQRNRIHVDVFVAHDQARARVDAALAAGGRLVRDRAPFWWTLADPEGNEVDVAVSVGREEAWS